MPPRLPRPLLQRVLCTLLIALLWTQWSARVHAVEHGPAPGAVGTLGMAAAVTAPATAGAEGPAASAHDHWAHGAGSAECRLLDQLLGVQAPGPSATPTPGSAPACEAPAARPTSAQHAQPPGWPQARAPPRA
jgi:hypothetical protein